MKVVVLGQGYVGLPLAVRAAEVGHRVIGFEPDRSKAARLLAGDSYVADVSSERLLSVLDSGHFRATYYDADLVAADIYIITVPTPLLDGLPDISYIEAASKTVGRVINAGSSVVLESTTYPGTTEDIVGKIVTEESGLLPEQDYGLGFSPERIDPGNVSWNFQNTPKIVSGVGPKSLSALSAFYGSVCETIVEVSSPKVAELSKILENTFRHVNIALVNEMAIFAHSLGIDIWEVVSAASTKPFGYMTHRPGPGVGGHCIPVDPAYMSWKVKKDLGKTFRFIELANEINNYMPEYVVSRAVDALNDVGKAVSRSRVLVLGLSYKADTSDTRESPSLKIIENLRRRGANVDVLDPYFLWSDDVEYSSYDIVILVTDHSAFDYETIREKSSLILDCKNRFETSPNVVKL